MKNGIFSVSELNTYIKKILDSDLTLRFIKLEGELSDVKVYSSGHMYFNIIDKDSSISAVMFESYRLGLSFKPKDGDKVMITGSVNVYVKNGRYQLYVNQMFLSGEGEKLLKLQLLKKKLQAEGLFDESKKKPINLYPNAIGLITAKNSAAASDLINNLHRRYPIVNIYTFYTLVQGDNAPKAIVEALNKAYTYPLDTIIVGRGGGSNEDLSAFNDEEVVRTAFASPIPIIAAVGHEVDYTLLDFVASKRASTPTGAAELATIDKRELYEYLDNAHYTMYSNILNKLKYIKEKLNQIKSRPFFVNPENIYKDKLNKVNSIKDNLNNAMKLYLSYKTSDLRGAKERLEGVNPKRVLKRGFALLKNKNGKIIKKVEDVKLGEEIVSQFDSGTLYSSVTRKEKNDGKERNN